MYTYLRAFAIYILKGFKMPREIAMIGKKYNRLFVVSVASRLNGRPYKMNCICDCGTKKEVNYGAILTGASKSCGCLKKEHLIKYNFKHGYGGTKIHDTWKAMIDRCFNPKNKNFNRYGGRGIIVCNEWLIFDNFLHDMGEPQKHLSIDRIDNNGNYSKDNCRWATHTQQERNKSTNAIFTHNGKTMCMKEWAEYIGINYSTLANRLYRGWTFDRAIIKKSKKYA